MNRYLSVFRLLFQPSRLKALLSFNHKGYLYEIGWFNSFKAKAPLDINGEPIPWVTYPFIDLINERIKKEHAVFEFGSGNSTFYYAKHAGIVVSVEHDKTWYERIVKNKPDNSEIIFCELVRDGDYCRMPVKLEEKFDIIIIDGRDRVNCCKHAIDALTPSGVIVLDNSERESYKAGIDFLIKSGFKHLAFSGIVPGLFYRVTTSLFYKEGNCLGI